MDLNIINKLTNSFIRKVYNLISCAILFESKTGNKGKTLVTAKTKSAGGTIIENVEIFNDYGFVSIPPDNSEAIVIYPRANKNTKGIIIKTVNRDVLPDNLKQGDSAIFDNKGQLIVLNEKGVSINDKHNNFIKLTENGIIINGIEIDKNGNSKFPATIKAKDTITSDNDVLASSISLKNHIHQVPGAGCTAGGSPVVGIATSQKPQ